MLVGTFQELPYDSVDDSGKPHIVRNFSQVPGRHVPGIDFRPIWAFAIDSVADGLTQAVIAAPNVPEVFCLAEVNEDDLIRLDTRVRSYWLAKQDRCTSLEEREECDRRAVVDAIDPDVANRYAELLVRPDAFDKGIIDMLMILPNSFKSNLDARKAFATTSLRFRKQLSSQNYEKMVDGIGDDLFEVSQRIPLVMSFSTDGLEAGIEERRRLDLQFELRNIEKRFILTQLPFWLDTYIRLFPLLDEISPDGMPFKFDGRMIFTYAFSFDRLIIAANRYSMWCNSDIPDSHDPRFDVLYDDIRSCAFTDGNLLDALLEEGIPSRNELCPCGSGRKWKKCHGRFVE